MPYAHVLLCAFYLSRSMIICVFFNFILPKEKALKRALSIAHYFLAASFFSSFLAGAAGAGAALASLAGAAAAGAAGLASSFLAGACANAVVAAKRAAVNVTIDFI
jgi:hypothetical protein